MDVHAVSVPSRRARADFYEVAPEGAALRLAIADVAGEGLSAEALGALLEEALRSGTGAVRPVAEVVASLNTRLWRDGDPARPGATLFLGRLSRDLRLVYSNAGHNPPLLLRSSGELELLLDGGTLLGALERAPFLEAVVELAPGDRLALYTDGLTEREGPHGDRYGVERLITALRRQAPPLSPRDVAAGLLASLEDFAQGVEPADDLTLIVLGVRGSAAAGPAAAPPEASGG